MTPLRLSAHRLWLYATALTLAGAGQIIHSTQFNFRDWRGFVVAGKRVGSASLLHQPDAFLYLPGAAWALVPAAHLTLAGGFVVNALSMLACAIGAAMLAARAFRIPIGISCALVLAWAPTTNALVVGQIAPLGLLLTLTSLVGYQRGSIALTAVPLGLLLYKPTYALPLVVLLALRRAWRELVVVALVGAGWYLASVAATGGDWLWPQEWLAVERGWFAADFASNAPKALGITTLLMRANVAGPVIAAVALALCAAAAPLLRRAVPAEAYAVTCLLGIALSPHAWTYDAVLVLPALFAVVATDDEPWRTRIVVAAYLLAPLLLVSHLLRFDALAFVVIGLLAIWFVLRLPRAELA